MDDGHRPSEKPRRKRSLLGLALALVLFAGLVFLLPSFGQEVRGDPADFKFAPSGLYEMPQFTDTDSKMWLDVRLAQRIYLFKRIDGFWETEVQFPGFVQRVKYKTKELALLGIDSFLDLRTQDAKHRAKTKN